jgi:hypothetical protein
VKYCIFCGQPIQIHETYQFYGDDTSDDAVRAHEAHIELEPYRWIELGRTLNAAPQLVDPVD